MHLKHLCLPVLLSTLALSGCTTISPQEARARDEATCRTYGFRKGTDAFAACLQRIDLDRSQTRRARLYGDPAWNGGIGVGIGYGRYVW